MRMPMKLLLAACGLGALALTAYHWPGSTTTIAPAPAESLASPAPSSADTLRSEGQDGPRAASDAPTRTPLATDTENRTPTDSESPPDAELEEMVVHVVDSRGRSQAGAAVFRTDRVTANDVGLIQYAADGTLELKRAMALTFAAPTTPSLDQELGQTFTLRGLVTSDAQVSGSLGSGTGSMPMTFRVHWGQPPPDDGEPPKLLPLGTTDASGKCRVRVARGTVLLATTSDGCSSGLIDSGDDAVRTDGEIVLPVYPTLLVRGVVVDAAGRPLAGSTLAARASGRRGAARGRSLADVATDDDGGFVLALDAVATFEITARLGNLQSETLRLDARAAVVAPVRIRMVEAIAVRGDVRDPLGALRAEASVRVRRADVDPGADRFAKPFDATVTTDAEGAFQVLVPGPGRYVAIASHDEHAPSAPTAIAVGAPRGEDVTHLLLRTWATMSGTVRWDDASPVVGAQLTARPEPGAGADDTEPRTTETGDDGSFVFANLPGHLRYELICVPHPALPHTRVVRPGIWPSTQDFVLEQKALRGASVRIRLIVPAGVRYESGSVLVSRLLPSGWARGEDQSIGFDGDHFGTVDALVPGETYAVELRGEYSRCRTAPFVAGVDAERSLTLKHAGSVTVLVREADGSPAFGATAILREDAPVGLRRDDAAKRTDLHGRAHWESVSSLPWFILAAREGIEGDPVPLLVEPNTEHRIEVRLR